MKNTKSFLSFNENHWNAPISRHDAVQGEKTDDDEDAEMISSIKAYTQSIFFSFISSMNG